MKLLLSLLFRALYEGLYAFLSLIILGQLKKSLFQLFISLGLRFLTSILFGLFLYLLIKSLVHLLLNNIGNLRCLLKKKGEGLVVRLASRRQKGIPTHIRARKMGGVHTKAKSFFRDRNISCFFKLQSSAIS